MPTSSRRRNLGAIVSLTGLALVVLFDPYQPALTRRAASRTTTVELNALRDPISLSRLSENVDAIIDGVVIGVATGELAFHPNLKADLTPDESSLVEAGYRYIQWTVRVSSWVKGDGPATVSVVRGLNGPSRSVGAEQFPELVVGATNRFWLSPGVAYLDVPYFVLEESRVLPISGQQ